MLYIATEILGAACAEDAVQDVFVKLMEKFDEKNFADLCDKPGRFFVIVTRNHSLNLFAKANMERSLFDKENEEEDIFSMTTPDPETILLDNEADDKLVALIRRLKPTVRQLLEYRYIIGYSNKEIAEIFGVSQTLISTQIERAKKRLKEMLQDEMVIHNAN
jgi:RNA polymerase sigma-70 factor (ECF subfamily)